MDTLQEAAIFYKESILKYVFIFKTIDDYLIIVCPETKHFFHLIGAQHSKNLVYFKNNNLFYRKCLKGDITLKDLISSIESDNEKEWVTIEYLDSSRYFMIYYLLMLVQ